MTDTGSQKTLIESLLTSADHCIREGRYVAGDEFLQKVLQLQPDNPTARVYQERIQFLTNQLAHRTGLQPEMQNEIRHYRELLIKRRSTEINSHLTEVKRHIEEGYFDEAYKQLVHALAIDPGNLYARELERRLAELRRASPSGITKEREYRYRSKVIKYWINGKPSPENQERIMLIRKEIGIPDNLATGLEHEVQCDAYRDALYELWSNGGLVGFTDETIENLRKNYAISRLDHAAIERLLLQAVRRNKILGTVLVVDSDTAILNDLTYKLRINSYSVIGAISIEEALASFKICRPDIVISTVEFSGGESGFSLFEVLHSLPNCATLPVFLTGTSFDRTTLLIGKRLGVEEFFLKPLDFELLIATFRGTMLRIGGGKARQHPLIAPPVRKPLER
jgi:tetratricopeptide (TPR) repeat protein